MRILFPTDFSKAADHAFIYALKVADKIKGDITTVHVYDVPHVRAAHLPHTMSRVNDSIALEQFENYKDHIPHLREIAATNDLRHIRVNHAMEAVSKKGVVHTIVSSARKAEADFIIMGTTGASGMKEAFLGSVAAEVLENATTPVLAVPVKAEFDGRIDTIAFATEYSDADKLALKSTLKLAEMLDAKVLCVHVDTSHREKNNSRMEAFVDGLKDNGPLEWYVVDNSSIEEGLIDFAVDYKIDIFAMRVKKRNFIEELFTYSLTKKMANRLVTPVFGLHE